MKRTSKKSNKVLHFFSGLLIITAIALMPAGRAVAVGSWPRGAPTAWAVVQLLSGRCSSTRRSTDTTAGTVIRGADDEEVGVALCAVTRPLTPVLRRGRAIELLFARDTQRIVAAVGGEVAVLRNVAAVRAGLLKAVALPV